jgi:pimeloyl-ACP methyl ester carboxylesterase
MLPGIGDTRDAFESAGLVEEWLASNVACDLLLVDAHFTYYREGNLAERVRDDVLRPARLRGYTNIWLVGFSIGGYGALWTARENPQDVDGIVLVAPMIGVPPRSDEAAAEVRAAGGLNAWASGELEAPAHHFREPRTHWAWLAEVIRAPDTPPVIVLAYGTEDGAADTIEVLAEALPPQRVLHRSGGHDWATWRALFGDVLVLAPWRAARSEP